jgi:hypothetical protein
LSGHFCLWLSLNILCQVFFIQFHQQSAEKKTFNDLSFFI